MEILNILIERHIELLREENIEITAEDALGRLVAKYVKWNGLGILRVAASALEDANLRAECEVVERMANELKGETEIQSSESKVETLTEEALGAFWEIIASRFPEAKHGDLSPLRTLALSRAATTAVKEWIDNNVLPQRENENS